MEAASSGDFQLHVTDGVTMTANASSPTPSTAQLTGWDTEGNGQGGRFSSWRLKYGLVTSLVCLQASSVPPPALCRPVPHSVGPVTQSPWPGARKLLVV